MPWIERDATDKIVTELANPRKGAAFVAETDPELAAFRNPPNPIPAQVELWKARVVMKSTPWAGKYGGPGRTVFDAASAAIAAMTDQAKKRAAVEAMDYTNFLTRNGTVVRAIQQAIEMTDAQCDALFQQAAAIQN